MPGTILENLSGRKLAVLVAFLLTCQIVCFLVGLIPPSPAGPQSVLATLCVDRNPDNKELSRWFDRTSCELIKDNRIPDGFTADNIVFTVLMPSQGQDFSRWQQNLIGLLDIEPIYDSKFKKMNPVVEITLDVRLAFSDKTRYGGRTPWEYYAHSEEKRYIECDIMMLETESPYTCSMIQLFELGSLYHDYYLLNMRLPYNETEKKNVDLRARIGDVTLNLIHMNGGYTMVWLAMKAVFFPIVSGVMFWFWRRVHILSRTPALLEYMLISLGSALVFLNLPIEYLTLYFDMPYALLLSDIRQGVFYAMLLSFWLVFAGEHMLIQDNGEKNSIKLYWKHLSTIIIGCASLLIFDLCERGVQLVNPFYSIWVTPIGTNLALTFIILAGISASMYFIFLCYMIWKVFKNISIKRSVLPSMSQARRLHYEGIIYRFNFLMLATLICAAVTIIAFIMSQVSEGQHKWDDNIDWQISSVLHTGVYGMWNVYICAMLMLYAPSHKQWPEDPVCTDGEEVEFNRFHIDQNPNEISSLTAFAAKTSID